MTLGINMITRKMNPFFSSTLWALSVDIFHFCISRPSKLNSMGTPFVFFGLWNAYLHDKDDTFKLVNIDILLCKICKILI